MKKIIAIMFSFLCFWGAFGCESSAKTPDSNQKLFDKEVLSYYEIPWLKKPENSVVHEMEKNVYRGIINSKEDFWAYGEYVYQTLAADEKYFLGGTAELKQEGELFSRQEWYLAEKPNSFGDCCKGERAVEIFYSTQELGVWLDTEKGGYRLYKPVRIYISLNDYAGSYKITIYVSTPTHVYVKEK